MRKKNKHSISVIVLGGVLLLAGVWNNVAAGTFTPSANFSECSYVFSISFSFNRRDITDKLVLHSTGEAVGIEDVSGNATLYSQYFHEIGEIIPEYSHAWGENVGWVNFRPEGVKLEIGGNILKGLIEIKTLGWVYLGDGKPEKGMCYSNSHGSDYGVNNDGKGDLSGYAWSENVGWINFEEVTISKEGNFSGYAYSKNVGRIRFKSEGSAKYLVKTDPYPWKEIGVREEIKAAKGSLPDNGSESIGLCNGSQVFIIPQPGASLDLYWNKEVKTIEDELVFRFETAENKIDFRIGDRTKHARGPPEREQPNQISKQFVVQSFRAADKTVLKDCTVCNLIMII
jgi:hypothetical protein